MPLRTTVIGTGYLGTTQAACLAESGHEVIGVDADPDRVATLASGRVPFFEPDLGELVRAHVASGRLRLTTSFEAAGSFGDVHFLCVGTPQRSDGFGADLGQVESALDALAPTCVGSGWWWASPPSPCAPRADGDAAVHGVAVRLAADGLDAVPVTSGSKGLQLYAPVSGGQSPDVARDYLHQIARELESAHPSRVVSRMAKDARRGKVFLDWSQNDSAKTTIALAAWSSPPLGGRSAHLGRAGGPRFAGAALAAEVPDRIADLGDLAETVNLQTPPGPRVPSS